MENKKKYKYLNMSLILNNLEQSILIKMINGIVYNNNNNNNNNNNIDINIPKYIFHLFQYCCYTKYVIEFIFLWKASFIYKFKEFLMLILDDECDYIKLNKNIKIIYQNQIYFPFNKIKIKKIFKNIQNYVDCN